jgi:hypothetical protein
MSTPSRTTEFLDAVERWTKQRLCHRDEIKHLIDLSFSSEHREEFGEIVLLGKFLWNTHNVMKRVGPGGEGYSKLSEEFSAALEKFTASVRGVLANGNEELRARFERAFLAMNSAAMTNLMDLLNDLGQLKNYAIDTKQSYY